MQEQVLPGRIAPLSRKETPWKWLFALYIIIVLLQVLAAITISSPSLFSDEYYYSKLARSFFFEQEFRVHNQPAQVYPPLYPMMLSPAYLLQDSQAIYLAMKLLNALLISSSLFPLFFLARSLFTQKKALLVTGLCMFIPSFFLFPLYIMAENLFYPLVLWSLFFLYQSTTTQKTCWHILAGIAMAASFLTKMHGLALFPLPLALFLLQRHHKQPTSKKQLLWIYIFLVLTISPWLLSRGIDNGFTLSGILGVYGKEVTSATRHSNFLPTFLNWLLMYSAYLILALGILPAFFIPASRNKNPFTFWLCMLAVVLFVMVIAYTSSGSSPLHPQFPWFTGRPIGRYLEGLLPLTVLLAFAGMEQKPKTSTLIAISILALLGSQLTLAALFPANNFSLVSIGILKSVLGKIVLGSFTENPQFSWLLFSMLAAILAAATIAISIVVAKKHLQLKHLAVFLCIFFLLSTAASYTIIQYNVATYWENNEQILLGKWFNQHNRIENPRVVIDEKFGSITPIQKTNIQGLYQRFNATSSSSSVAGFFMNADISVGNPQDPADYFITKDEYPLQLLYETQSGIRLYKNEPTA